MAQLIDIQTTLSPPLGRDTIIPTLNTGRGCRHPPGWRTQRSRASNWAQPRRSGPTFIHMYLVSEVSVSDLKSKNAYLSISITHTSHLCCGGPPSLLASYPLISGFCGENNGCVLIRCPGLTSHTAAAVLSVSVVCPVIYDHWRYLLFILIM